MGRRSQSASGSSRSSGRRRATAPQAYVLPFRGSHLRLLAIVLGVILAGFIALAYESITLAPLLMVSGYCVGIPVILIWRGKFRAPVRPATGNHVDRSVDTPAGD